MRVIHDPIHGTFQLHDLSWLIIDTPEFQRLRNIKQTANTCFVYPSARHTRFEHSLGVAHLCEFFCDFLEIKSKKQYLDTTTKLVIQIAGLCHDLGHCAFSHLFDDVIANRISKVNTRHEHFSYLILKRIYENNKAKFHDYNFNDDQLHLVGKLILGSKDKIPDFLKEELVWNNSDDGNFIYQIISNEINGIDVDKFDYIKRDCYYTGVTCGFDAQRLMQFGSIKEDSKGRSYINYNKKANEIINEMWRSRSDLHRRVYRHRVVQVVDEMISEIFSLVSDLPIVTIFPSGDKGKIQNAVLDLDLYLSLSDNIISKIKDYLLNNKSANNNRALSIINSINNRKLWKTLAKIVSTKPLDIEEIDNICISKTILKSNNEDENTEYIYYLILADNFKGDIKAIKVLLETKYKKYFVKEMSFRI